MLVRDAAGTVKQIPVQSAPAHNYILGIDFQGDDLWVATARGLSHGIREIRLDGNSFDSKRRSFAGTKAITR